jgi:hypothetical protein
MYICVYHGQLNLTRVTRPTDNIRCVKFMWGLFLARLCHSTSADVTANMPPENTWLPELNFLGNMGWEAKFRVGGGIHPFVHYPTNNSMAWEPRYIGRIESRLRILKAHSHLHWMSGSSIWASLECHCCFWIAGGLVSYLTMWLLILQLFKNSIDTQEMPRLNLHSLSVSVSELVEHGRKSNLLVIHENEASRPRIVVWRIIEKVYFTGSNAQM